MNKNIINYNDKDYQVSTVYIDNMATYETMVFPIENGIISGSEVYCYRTVEADISMYIHNDILYNPKNYLSEEAIANYLKEKENWFNEPDNIEDVMIRASKKAGLTRKQLHDMFFKEGVMAVYNLGMKHMYEYLKEKDNEKAV